MARRADKKLETKPDQLPKAPIIRPIEKDADVFSSTYFQAQQLFRRAANGAAIFNSLALQRVGRSSSPEGMKGMEGEDLTIDIAVFGNTKNPSKMFFCTSGVHGPEGFAGSAVQVAFLRDRLPSTLAQGQEAVYVLLHAFNPYGMSWGRRWNESNVDLNRNCYPKYYADQTAMRTMPTPYKQRGTPKAYEEMNHIINPKGPLGVLDFVVFYFSFLICLIKLGFGAIRQAIAGGQSGYPDGLFFGGVRLEQSPKLVIQYLRTLSAEWPLKKVVHLDLHTGLGPYGKATLLADRQHEGPLFRRTFGPGSGIHAISGQGKGTDVYSCEGSTCHMTREIFEPRGVEVIAGTVEFGTKGNIAIFRALRAEGVMWKDLGEQMSATNSAKRGIIAAMYPHDDLAWKRNVQYNGVDILSTAIQRLLLSS